MKRYYFDYAAATPMDLAAEKAMRPYWSKIHGHPGSLHWFGQEASAAVFEARRKMADLLGCHYQELVFTSSATEANNLALRGIVKNTKKPKIIISSIEHESVLATAMDLEKSGAEVVLIPVSQSGFLDLEKLKSALDERTVLVSIIYANNQIGVIQPIVKIAEIIRNFREKSKNIYPLFHTDAAQAFNYLDCRVNDLGIDLMTLSSPKIYGPKGAGLLYVKNQKFKISSPIITGGGQEFGLRSGTENVPGIIGFAKAAEIADKLRIKETKRLRTLQDYFLNKAKKMIPEAQLNGDHQNRLVNNINMYFPGNSSQELVIKLDLFGFAVSPGGAACSARVCLPSRVIKALGFSDERATGSLRITFGRQTTKQEIDKLLEAIKRILV